MIAQRPDCKKKIKSFDQNRIFEIRGTAYVNKREDIGTTVKQLSIFYSIMVIIIVYANNLKHIKQIKLNYKHSTIRGIS